MMARAVQVSEDALYFLTYAHTLTPCLSDKSQIHTVKLLLEWITDIPGSENPETHEALLINSDFVLDLERHRRDVPQYLKTFASKSKKVKEKAKQHFSDVLKEVISEKFPDLISGLSKLIQRSNIAASTVKKWKGLLENKDYAQFLADVFLYALQEKAPVGRKTKKATDDTQLARDVLSDIERLNALAARVGELTPIRKPPEIASCERDFIKPLFAAYGSIDGKTYCQKNELPDRLQRDIEVRRDHFYKAETVRIQGTDALGPIGAPQFIALTKEILAGVYDVCFDTDDDNPARNGYIRMRNVMKCAAVLPCSKSIFSKTNWVGAEEKQGICHILAGEKQLQWVIPNE